MPVNSVFPARLEAPQGKAGLPLPIAPVPHPLVLGGAGSVPNEWTSHE